MDVVGDIEMFHAEDPAHSGGSHCGVSRGPVARELGMLVRDDLSCDSR